MSPTFHKLNLKDQKQIVVVNAPESFEPELAGLQGVKVLRQPKDLKEIEFFLAFVTTQNEIDTLSNMVGARAKGDAVVWFAYPKGSSKRYQSEIKRDAGWHALGKAGFEGVRQVAIDEDWSALRFRRPQFIKTMTRGPEHRMSAQGRARAQK
jgi:hypothetical protein